MNATRWMKTSGMHTAASEVHARHPATVEATAGLSDLRNNESGREHHGKEETDLFHFDAPSARNLIFEAPSAGL